MMQREFEPNFGGGMWGIAFGPVLNRIWKGGCSIVESEWVNNQKEVRIIDTIEPVVTQHRLVISEDVIRNDAKRALAGGEGQKHYSFLYQYTHITRDRGSLKHDDRLDAVAGAVAHYMRSMGQDMAECAQGSRDVVMMEEVERLLEWQNGDPLFWRNSTGSMRCAGKRLDGSMEEVTVYRSTIG